MMNNALIAASAFGRSIRNGTASTRAATAPLAASSDSCRVTITILDSSTAAHDHHPWQAFAVHDARHQCPDESSQGVGDQVAQGSDAAGDELLRELHRETEHAADQSGDHDGAGRPALAPPAHEQQPEWHVGKHVGHDVSL